VTAGCLEGGADAVAELVREGADVVGVGGIGDADAASLVVMAVVIAVVVMMMVVVVVVVVVMVVVMMKMGEEGEWFRIVEGVGYGRWRWLP